MDIPEGQIYYDSLLELYASWGVDFIKVDDIAYSTIYPDAHRAEIAAIRKAIDKTGREIVLSLSPGPASLSDGSFLQENANMWRLTDDYWDEWPLLLDMFERCSQWAPFVRVGNWPDCDMLPLGHIGIRSGERGLPERMTNFTKPEQKTMLTLWSIFQSPLMFGGELNSLDDWTLGLLTNGELAHMHRTLTCRKQVYRDKDWIVWSGENSTHTFSAVFNIADEKRRIPQAHQDTYAAGRNIIELWSGLLIEDVDLSLEAHDCMIFKHER